MTHQSPWFVYILQCSDGTLYTGVTTDIESRLSMHNAGKGAKYTRVRLPAQLVYSESADSHSAALQREHAIKKLTRKQKQQLVSL